MDPIVKELAGYGVLGFWLLYELLYRQPAERKRFEDVIDRQSEQHSAERAEWRSLMDSVNNLLGKWESKLDK